MDLISQIGVGGTFAVIVIKIVLDELRDRRDAARRSKLETIAQQTRDLWEWHNVNDQNGVKLWYSRRSLEDTIRKLVEIAEHQRAILERIDLHLSDLKERMKQLEQSWAE